MRARITALAKPARGTATKARRARKRAADAILARNAATVRERDGHRCRVYGTTGWLEVHHIVPRSRGGKHETFNLVLLSKKAHDEVHAGQRAIWGNADGLLFSQRLGTAWVHALPIPGMRASTFAVELFDQALTVADGRIKKG